MPATDFNFKVALAEGSKNLAAGKLKKAEEQFRYAVKRCPECGAGHRGLARVYVEVGERTLALAVLREGAQTLARAGNRGESIGLLQDAVALAPDDLTIHRRLAASLANAGSEDGAIAEYERFVGRLLAEGDAARAEGEVRYARELLGDASGLSPLAQKIVVARREARAPERPPAAPVAPAALEERVIALALARAEVVEVAAATAPEPQPVEQPLEELVRLAPAGPERMLALEAQTQALLSRGDERAAAQAVQVASALLAEGKLLAAADLLLQVVASGATDRDAQRLLVDVARALGKSDLARDKCLLIAHAYRLDGKMDAAAEMERLAAV